MPFKAILSCVNWVSISCSKRVEYAETLLRFFDRLGGVTGKSESLVEGNPKVFYLRVPWNWMANDANIGRWKFYRSPATGEVYCLGLGGIDFPLPLFEKGRKSHKETLRCKLYKDFHRTRISLLWGESVVKKFYKDGQQTFVPDWVERPFDIKKHEAGWSLKTPVVIYFQVNIIKSSNW
jgi:hypothetical protein